MTSFPASRKWEYSKLSGRGCFLDLTSTSCNWFTSKRVAARGRIINQIFGVKGKLSQILSARGTRQKKCRCRGSANQSHDKTMRSCGKTLVYLRNRRYPDCFLNMQVKWAKLFVPSTRISIHLLNLHSRQFPKITRRSNLTIVLFGCSLGCASRQ